jgi:hypothetical protein
MTPRRTRPTTVAALLEALRAAVRTQLALQQIYADRHELSGRETAAAARALRWRGDELVGCELPRA